MMICKKCGHNTKEDYWKEEPIKTSGRRSWTNTKRGGKTKQYRLSKKIEELERKLKVLQ